MAIEEIGRVDQSMGITLQAGVGLGINPILTYGTQEQKERWLPALVAGAARAGFGLTEPGAGSDAGATATRAELAGEEWVVNGAKQFITNSGSAITSLVTATARTGTRGTAGPRSPRSWCPRARRASPAEKAYDKLGWHASDTHPLSFDDVRVPADHLLGERGRGYAQFLATLDDGRVAISALSVGCIQACLDMALAYAGERQTFGGPSARKQGVAFQRPTSRSCCHASRMLTYRAAAMKTVARRTATSSRRPRWPSSTPPSRRSPRPASRRRSSAATASWRSTPWRGSTATPRCSRSARAPPRCSGCSSRGAWPAGGVSPVRRAPYTRATGGHPRGVSHATRAGE